MMTVTGLPEWQAPEMLEGKAYTNKVDLWSAGCVLYFMLSGTRPFPQRNVSKLHQAIRGADVNYTFALEE